MHDEDYYFSSRVILSFQNTKKAWKLEAKGMHRWKVASMLGVSDKTIIRSYQRYGFKSPKRKWKND